MNEDRLPKIERLLRVAESELSHLEKQREFLIDQIASLRREKESLQFSVVEESPATYSNASVTSHSSEQEKIRLFRDLFRGREDVYARRFESHKTGRTGISPNAGTSGWRASARNQPSSAAAASIAN